MRLEAAIAQRDLPLPDHVSNGDEQLYVAKLGNFSKGLPHNDLDEVDQGAYTRLLNALTSTDPAAMDDILMGSPDPARQLKLVNPFAGLAFDLEGADAFALTQPPPPALRSAEAAGEMVELYWMALLRDVAFTDYETHPLAEAACAELSHLSDFRGPKSNGQVTPKTLFRGITAGDVAGPYLSQFMVRPVSYGAQAIDQKIRPYTAGVNYLTDYNTWLSVQNGIKPLSANTFENTRVLMRNGRDLSEWVHVDVLFQAYFNAAVMLLSPPDTSDPTTGGGFGAPLSSTNPYAQSKTQVGFGTFGGPFVATIVTEVATRALKAVWHQKWFVHRRLRPEEYGGRLHNRLAEKAGYFLHPDVTQSEVAARIKHANGSWLLPMAFPEGCPIHPSYGAGHATVAGACVTVLKALFDENFPMTNPMVPSADGQTLVPYTGSDAGQLTVGGELNKLAANVAVGRNLAGVHYRSDYAASLRLGEQVAMAILRDQRNTFHEDFSTFNFTSFDGQKIVI